MLQNNLNKLMRLSLDDFHYLLKNDHYPAHDIYNVVLYTEDLKLKTKLTVSRKVLDDMDYEIISAAELNKVSDVSEGIGIYAEEIDSALLV